MALVPNAKQIALKALSMWANYLGILCLIAPEIIYWVFEVDTNPRIWWILGLVLIVVGIVGRVWDQGIDRSMMRMPWLVLIAAMAAVPVMAPSEGIAQSAPYSLEAFDAEAVPLIAKWEGLRTTAYLDRIAHPPVWTVCYGETKGVRAGDSYTKAQCDAMLAREVRGYRAGLHRYFTHETKASRLTAKRDAAYTSLAYNAGISAIGKSTATRRLNAGDIRGGCEALAWWNRAGGRVVRGLMNRRADETKLCLAGLT